MIKFVDLENNSIFFEIIYLITLKFNSLRFLVTVSLSKLPSLNFDYSKLVIGSKDTNDIDRVDAVMRFYVLYVHFV